MRGDDQLSIGVRALAHFARFLERACEGTGVTLSQYRLLSYIESAEQRAGALAERAAVSRPALTAAVDGLVERGLAARERASDDRRAILIRLTPEGRRAMREVDRGLGELLTTVIPPDRLADVLDAAVVLGEGMARTVGDEGSAQVTKR